MRFPAPLIPATLIRRYKRFLADAVLPDGSETTVHVANPGSMLGIAAPGSRIMLSRSENQKRKRQRQGRKREAEDDEVPQRIPHRLFKCSDR
jgi:sugar fermentation stimulation protein A